MLTLGLTGNYRLGGQTYYYREQLLKMHRRGGQKLEIDLAHLGEYDLTMLGYVMHQPAALWAKLELAAADALKTLLYDRQREEPGEFTTEEVDTRGLPSIQILVKGNLQSTPLRSIQSQHMNRLLRCPGIVISAAPVRNRAVLMQIRCHRCLDTQSLRANDDPYGSLPLPSQCRNNPDCGKFPYAVVPDESQYIDQQKLKLQEAPEQVPTGEMPRAVEAVVDRALVDSAPPGTRVSLWCIPTLLGSKDPRDKTVHTVYLRVVGLTKDNDAHGPSVTFTPAEEEAFRALASRSDVYDILYRSIAPNIHGSYTIDIKKALLCQLMGGSPKKKPDGVRLRGDINVLLLGDPSMAKSQFLKFIAKAAPVGIYTSGKGSSAAGLTASVVKDRKGEFYLEGGAMVLADGGIVCIDEFDKMRPNDRVAIHEAMEQQTISVAKAGITTVLNSRASVLAAANPVYGRYDDFKSASENIDLMTTILSRFDCIFLVRDVREDERDRLICRHVMGVHISSSRDTGYARLDSENGALGYMANGEENSPTVENDSDSAEAIAENIMQVAMSGQGQLDVSSLKKYVQYCKAKCSPRLCDEAGEVLTSSYVKIRDDVRKSLIEAAGQSDGGDNQATIPITVRQLEALVRLSESLAKMRLDNDVKSQDVTEALRLFKVSTMAANSADQNVGETALLSAPNREEMERTEAFLRARMTIGSMMSKHRLSEQAASQGFNPLFVSRALAVMAGRGEVLERNQGRLIKRVK